VGGGGVVLYRKGAGGTIGKAAVESHIKRKICRVNSQVTGMGTQNDRGGGKTEVQRKRLADDRISEGNVIMAKKSG